VKNPSTSSRVAAVHENLFEYYRYLGRSPQAELSAGPQVNWLLTGIPNAFLNGVFRADSCPGDVVEQTLAHLRSRQVTFFSWWTAPGSPPPQLADRLLAAGLAFKGDGSGMAADLQALPESQPVPTGLTIEPVADDAALSQWIHVFAAGFGVCGNEAVSCGLFSSLGYDPTLCSYIGRLEGVPVATAQLFLGAGVAGLYWIGTLPGARRRGIGTAMTRTVLHEARDLGFRTAILHATPMGFGVYRRLGFREMCKMSRFVLVAPQPKV